MVLTEDGTVETNYDEGARWITRYFWISLDDNISKLIANFSTLKNILWYRKERLGKKASEIQLIGLIKLEKNL